MGTVTAGCTLHLAGELFRSTAGIDALVVPHKTTGEVIIATRNGNVDLAVDFIAPLLPHVRSGALRALAMTSARRFPGLPDVPTASEAGVPGYDVASWNALAAPAKTPRAVIEIEHPVEGRYRALGYPVKMSETKQRVRFPPPLLGEHTRSILEELGLGPEREELERGGAFSA